MANGSVIAAAVEGVVDEAVVQRLIKHVGAALGDVHGRRGKAYLRERMAGFNNAARHAPWFILVDLDRDADCAPPLRAAWLPNPSPLLCFRIAVREVEAWLLADRERLAEFLRVSRARIPASPERLASPKAQMVTLARNSRRRDIRADMVPRPESGRNEGPAYASRLIEFVSSRWRPDEAARNSDSLRRAIDCLRRLSTIG